MENDVTLTFPDLDLKISNVSKYKGLPTVGSKALANALLNSKREGCEADMLALIAMRMTMSPKQMATVAAENKENGRGDVLCAINMFKKVQFLLSFFCVFIFF